jgi:putative membrane protein
MINILKISTIALGIAALLPGNPIRQNSQFHKTASTYAPQQTDAATLTELSALSTKHLRASALASEQGGSEVKQWGSRLSLILGSFNEELRTLAKKKSIVLDGTLPQGGQRPDGRVDASPENMKDTSRTVNGSGEAGNSGKTKTTPTGINDGASNALIESLKKLKVDAFDRAYKNLLISDRPKAEQLLVKASQSKDNDIASLGKKYLAKLKTAKR